MCELCGIPSKMKHCKLKNTLHLHNIVFKIGFMPYYKTQEGKSTNLNNNPRMYDSFPYATCVWPGKFC